MRMIGRVFGVVKVGFSRHDSGVRKEEKNPEAGIANLGVTMAFRHTLVQVIPWSGCVPAEPASVSPGQVDVSQAWCAHKGKQAGQAFSMRVMVTKAG
jgi:hypothetical protein